MSILDTAPHLEHHDEPVTTEHGHTWHTESVHATSEGRVRYLRCADCGTRRVELRTTDPRSDADLTSHDIIGR